jgi:hypothetical protein
MLTHFGRQEALVGPLLLLSFPPQFSTHSIVALMTSAVDVVIVVGRSGRVVRVLLLHVFTGSLGVDAVKILPREPHFLFFHSFQSIIYFLLVTRSHLPILIHGIVVVVVATVRLYVMISVCCIVVVVGRPSEIERGSGALARNCSSSSFSSL